MTNFLLRFDVTAFLNIALSEIDQYGLLLWFKNVQCNNFEIVAYKAKWLPFGISCSQAILMLGGVLFSNSTSSINIAELKEIPNGSRLALDAIISKLLHCVQCIFINQKSMPLDKLINQQEGILDYRVINGTYLLKDFLNHGDVRHQIQLRNISDLIPLYATTHSQLFVHYIGINTWNGLSGDLHSSSALVLSRINYDSCICL